MSEGYDGVHLKASGYRIKEMGDGFLCSVGYPFLAKDENPAISDLEIALRFSQILNEESTSLNYGRPISCGIGIAYGSITGFYPEVGAKENDLFGEGIILATRYEGMRKILAKDHPDRSVVVLQEAVFRSLDEKLKFGFQEVDLKSAGIGVRDDSAAERLYWKIL